MQTPPPIPSVATTSATPGYALPLATCAAAAALLSLPFAFLPFLGLAGAALLLGFCTALALWTRRKRVLIGAAVAVLAVIISTFSSFLCLQGIVASRNDAVAKVAHVQAQLETIKAQAATTSQQNVLGNLIKMLGGDDVTKEQADTLGKLGEWAISAMSAEESKASNKRDQN